LALILDAHVGLVSADDAAYPKREDANDWPPATVEDVLAEMDACGIDRALAAQAFFTYGIGNRYLIDCTEAHPDRLASGCALDPLAETAPDQLSHIVKNHGARGLRLIGGKRAGVFRDPRTLTLWQRAAELNVPVFVGAELAEVPDLAEPLERFPTVPVALDHMWVPGLGAPPYARIEPVLALARFANVHLKLLPNHTHAARRGGATARALVEVLADRFTPERLMWGSNYPAHRDEFGSIGDRLAQMREDLAFLGGAACERIFGGTAATFWRPARTVARQP
jgi:predicted TIM-barrel fold metal-dependent hydrolase